MTMRATVERHARRRRTLRAPGRDRSCPPNRRHPWPIPRETTHTRQRCRHAERRCPKRVRSVDSRSVARRDTVAPCAPRRERVRPEVDRRQLVIGLAHSAIRTFRGLRYRVEGDRALRGPTAPPQSPAPIRALPSVIRHADRPDTPSPAFRPPRPHSGRCHRDPRSASIVRRSRSGARWARRNAARRATVT